MARGNLRRSPSLHPHNARHYFSGSQLWRRMYRRGPGIEGIYAADRVPYTLQRAFRERRLRIPLGRRLELRDASRRYHQVHKFVTTGQFFTERSDNNSPEVIDLT